MLNYQGNQDFAPIDRSMSESYTSHLPQILEPVSVQKFLDRIMQYQVDPAQVGRQICQIIATHSDREMLLFQIANTLGVAFGADCCSIAAVTDKKVAIEHGCWQSRSDRPDSSDTVADLTQTPQFPQTTILNSPLISPFLAQVLADGEVAGISDIKDCQVASEPNSLTALLHFRAILAAPVRFGGAINGIIILGKSQPYEWSAADRQQLEAVSDSIALAISQIQKTQEITTLNQHLQQQAKCQNLLRRVASSIDTNSELDRILQRIIEHTAHTLQVERGQILLLKYTDPLFKTCSPNQIPRAKVELVCETPLKKDGSKQASVQSGMGKQSSTSKTKNPEKTANSKSKIPNSKFNSSQDFWMSESNLCLEAFKSAPKSFALADAGESIGNEHQKPAEILNLQGIRALLIVPLVSVTEADTVLGFIVLQHSSPRTWRSEELEVVELVATQLSTAIIQSQTLKKVQALVEDRTAQLEESLDIQAKLYEQSANQLEQLRKWKQIKDDFLDCVNHELRTPLTIMKLAIVMLKQAEQPLESRARYLDILEQKCFQEIGLIEDLLAVKQFESQQLSISPLQINLKHLIQDLARDFEQKWADEKLTLRVKLPKSLPSLESDRDSLHRILLELLTNAGKFSAAGTVVVLEVSAGVPGDIVMSVSNCGRGISTADLPHIFEKFRRGTGIAHQVIPGMGLGLALVKCLVKQLNGSIDVDSCPPESSKADELWRTSFTLTLPQFHQELSNVEK
jgi:signal transduction histidine kinase